ncbi:hypothetical protein AGOR_G00130850 [Albula goreensis]|uniref:Uncharacterized protein n=1 Tax=Albula goreensis TaxID=1534307 RepID=A0A8T3DBF6_9TELE|nr:hypothetical protein AGOR_G00130850 [Albula goreensis]
MYRRDREMIGRGVGGPLPRLPGPATVPLRTMEPALFYARRSLSYSDSDLSRLNTLLNLSENPQGNAANEPYASALKRQCLSQNSLRDGFDGSFRNGRGSIHSYASSVWEQRRLVNDRSPVSHTRRLLRDLQRSRSLGSPGHMQRGDGLSGRGGGKPSPKKGREEKNREDEEEDQTSEVPFIMIQTELTLEARRLLVAQALAVDLEQDGKEEHKQRVSSLQRELNSGVGCWESLCTERDPFVLSGLMWSWLEQLKEPVITRKDVQALEKKLLEPTIVLSTLDKGPQQTLTCILDCAAQVMTTPEDVESAFLNRTIKAFTKMKAGESEEEKTVYKTMREILASVLNEMRMKFLEEPETTDPFLYSSLPSYIQPTERNSQNAIKA